MLTLKTVSGRLKELFRGRDQTATDRVESDTSKPARRR